MCSSSATSMHLLADLVLGQAPRRRAQRKGEVVVHGQVRIERVLLEHEGGVARRRRLGRDVAPADARRVPASGRSRPATRRSVVVLPAPVGPSSTMNSPSAMSSDRSRTARTSPKRLVTPERRPQPCAASVVQRRCAMRGRMRVEQRQPLGAERESHVLADALPASAGQPRLDLAVRGVHRDDLGRAEIFGAEDLARAAARRRRGGHARAARRARAGLAAVLALLRHVQRGAVDADACARPVALRPRSAGSSSAASR